VADRRTVVITGASSGLGLAAAAELARRGDDVTLLGRNPGRLERAVDAVRAASGGRTPRAYRADFADLDEVRSVGERIAAETERIDVLVNNAGLLAPYPGATTGAGYDLTMQVNHLAGFLLAHLLLPRMTAAGGRSGPTGAADEPATGGAAEPARLITTASLAEAWSWLDVDRPARTGGRNRLRWLAYGASKQANVLFTVEAARRWTPLGVVPVCFFPGLVRSRFATTSPLFMLGKLVPLLVVSPRRGAGTLVDLATGPAPRPGGYYFMGTEMGATPRATNPQRAARLWAASLAAVGLPPG
jgi:NAD(P)-dependent dehydrogenase (short-subunit alcohol dehydrogenase family)